MQQSNDALQKSNDALQNQQQEQQEIIKKHATAY